MKRRVAIVVAVFVIACGKPPNSPSDTETITGSERFGWDQPAADAGELTTFRFAIYVDDARSEAAEVNCSVSPTSGRFTCTSRLPEMSTGTHSLQVASFTSDGAIRESARSAAVRVNKR